ncbi:MAG: hypothetical protein JXR37_33570 [Kiritimatiellae bacterium]|nr:hypothetical protein [Kiritimatiellia bacterium]
MCVLNGYIGGKRAAPIPLDMLEKHVLERLIRSGRIRLATERVPGMFDEGTVPQVTLHLCSQSPG